MVYVTMHSYHIHIGGLVQGVGFRPHVCRTAVEMQLTGHVCNGKDGVHIWFNAEEDQAALFYKKIISSAPKNSLISFHSISEIPYKAFSGFTITESDASAKPDLLLTPDLAICPDCLSEIRNPQNRRHEYAFTTCLECGPRYSITRALPYDRENTSMARLKMCPHCDEEYSDIYKRRHYSQTNSCPDCSIPVHLYNNTGEEVCHDPSCSLIMIQTALEAGQVVAVKGIGGYLLLCDATNRFAITQLRERKHRPAKPFAVMYPSLAIAETDLLINAKEKEALTSKAAPIVLCQMKKEIRSGLCSSLVAPGLNKIGMMLPYTPLLALIADGWTKPLVATSGNISGSPIIYNDDDAILWLTEQADLVLGFDRDILTPQDDSVIQFAETSGQRIVLRRSRGMAPNYYPSPFKGTKTTLAMGADMKSAFALSIADKLYISQYLGDQGSYESQVSYRNTLEHLTDLLKIIPEEILIDAHPNYFSSATGKELAAELNIEVKEIQHHKAHFGAVLAENRLLQETENILGVIWDGTGYGEDEQVWGGEFFLFEKGHMERYMHLDYFPQLLGDKMSKEPRVSAVSLLRNNLDQLMKIKDLFSAQEREFYLKLLQQDNHLLTSSMGRFLDGIAAMLRIQTINSYEGEAAMKLEALARNCSSVSFDHYSFTIQNNRVDWQPVVEEILLDAQSGTETAVIARKLFVSLVLLIKKVADHAGLKKIAFSGGVFQNAFLTGLATELLGDEYHLYFHKELSPNDECISFGQMACVQLKNLREAHWPKQEKLFI